MSIKRTGRRVTIQPNRAFFNRLNEVKRKEGSNRSQAYYRVMLRGKVHRVVGRDGKFALVWVNGSKFNPFRIPASACRTVRSKPKETT
jgi:hypothetical protein